MAFERLKRFAKKWESPEREEIKKIREEKAFKEWEKKQLRKALKRKRASEIAKKYRPGRKGIPGESILDRLGESAQLEFGQQPKGKGKHYLEPLLGGDSRGFGTAALEVEGIMGKKRTFGLGRKRKKKKSRRRGSPRVIIIR